jgi:hypothetical protein
MEPGGYPVVGQVVFAGALILTALLERLQFQLRASESSLWWASNGRDVVNVLALGVMSVGLRAVGLTGPMSLGIAATATIVLTALQPFLDKHRHGGLLTGVVAMALGLPVLIHPQALHQGFQAVVLYLFPASR